MNGAIVFRGLTIATLLMGAGCFDVHSADPGPYLIDDFEDQIHVLSPADHHFAPWSCDAYNPPQNNFSCGLDYGTNEQGHSLVLRATLSDPLNGQQESSGAAVRTYAAVPEDFTSFKELRLNVRVASGIPALPHNSNMYAQLGCTTAREDDVSNPPGNLYVLMGVPFSSEWEAVRLPLDNFGPPPWLTKPITGGTAGCLSRVDVIEFAIDTALPDGQTGMFVLNVDDIELVQ